MHPLPLMLTLFTMVASDVTDLGGYVYPQPYPPVQFDEPSTPSNTYIPPVPPTIQQDEVFPSLPVPVNPVPSYLPPTVYPPLGTPPGIFSDDTISIEPIPPLPPLYGPSASQVKIINMSCELDNKFQCLIRVSGRVAGFSSVVADDGVDNCVIPGPSQNTFFINMDSAKRMSDCGVTRCPNDNSKVNMCVTLRMPTVRNLKLPEDALVTLQCAPQDNIVAHTKHIRLGSNIISPSTRGRSNNPNTVIASGGSQRNFDTRINLFRKSSGSDNFDQLVQPGSTVGLGEELVLRAAVQEGDGWQYSRMGSVIVRSASNQRSINLVEDNGCLTSGIRSICPQQPRQLSPLVTVLPFRAFLFQGASKDDVMLLSVRMLGCIRKQDCIQSGFCNDPPNKSGLRYRRGINKNQTNSIKDEQEKDMTNWQSEFQFRVSAEPLMKSKEREERSSARISNEFIVLATLFGLLILAVIIVFIGKKIIY